MRAHEDEVYLKPPFKFQTPTFRLRSSTEGDGNVIPDIVQTCSYCGSMTPADVIMYMQTSGTRYGGSDWKYGWPHKFYIDIPCEPYSRIITSRDGPDGTIYERKVCTIRTHKFYSEHLRDATQEQLEEWNRIVAPLLGIRFRSYGDAVLQWAATRDGHQADGVVP